MPAIDLHNLCLAAALTLDPKVVARLVSLLPKVDPEESREDFISAAGIDRVEELRGMIEQFVRRRFPESFDNSVQTALIVLARGGPTDRWFSRHASRVRCMICSQGYSRTDRCPVGKNLG